MSSPTYFCSSCTLIFRLSEHDNSLGFNFWRTNFKNGGFIFEVPVIRFVHIWPYCEYDTRPDVDETSRLIENTSNDNTRDDQARQYEMLWNARDATQKKLPPWHSTHTVAYTTPLIDSHPLSLSQTNHSINVKLFDPPIFGSCSDAMLLWVMGIGF